MNAAEHVWVEAVAGSGVKVTVAVPPVQARSGKRSASALLVNTVLQPPVVVTPR